MRYIKILTLALFAGLIAACGGGGTAAPAAEVPVSVTLSAQVYDQAVANAEVSVYVGTSTTPVATTTSDSNGNFSVNLSVTQAARANNCVVVARRDNISLRSLLGNVGAITDTATANSGTVTATELPSANVTNVSTAVAAFVEKSGALPDTQADIDAALDIIAANANGERDIIIKISAAIKAVVDYGATVTAADTAALAIELANSITLQADVDAITTSVGVTTAQLELEVEGDPLLATQLPSDEATLVAGLVGNTYVTNDANGEETLVQFVDATNMKIAEYSNIEAGGDDGTYVDHADGSFTVSFIDSFDNAQQTVIVTVTGGSANAVIANININGVDNGSTLFRRMIPVGGTGGPTAANIAGALLVDVNPSTALHLGASCDGITADATLRSAAGETTGVTCDLAMGMVVISVNGVKTMHGLLADSWNTTTSTVSQQISVVDWKADATLGSVASYSRLYTPIDAGTPTLGPVLRLFPSDASGAVSAQLRFMTVVDSVAGDGNAAGSIDIYNQNGTTKTKDHILGETTALTGSLVVNGSINQGETFPTGTGLSVGINLGNNANSRINAIFKASGAIITRYQYKLSPIVAADVAGKTFTFNDFVFAADTATVVFSADDGTGGGTATATDSIGTEQFTWKIKVAPLASNVSTTSAVSDYGTTLSVTFADGTTDYIFAKKLGTSFVIGGYNLNDTTGAYVENLAAILTP